MSNTRTARGQAPAKAEAIDADVTFEHDGETYVIGPSKSWDLDALEAFDDGRMTVCVRLILGDEQYRKFKRKPRSIGDLDALFEEAQRAAGIEGN